MRSGTQLLAGHVDIVASDHSPAPTRDEERRFTRAWGGIAGVQSTLPVLIDRGHHERGLPLERIAALVAATPARRFRHRAQRAARVGYDADLVLVELGAIVHAAAR